MPLGQNDLRALVVIAGSREPMNPPSLQAELGLRRETVSRAHNSSGADGAGGAARLRDLGAFGEGSIEEF